MTGKTSLTVSFVTATTDPVTGANPAALSVDVDTAATAVDSPYPALTTVILRLFGVRDAAISASSLGCSVALASTGLIMPFTEVLTVVKAANVSLSYPSKSEPVLKWLSLKGAAGTVSLDPNDPATLNFSKTVQLGICEVTYDVSYNRYSVRNLSGSKALLLFEADDDRDCSIELDIASADTNKYDLTLTLADYSIDNLVIPSASVIITGPAGYRWTGQSNANGQIVLSGLSAGDYTFTATASGYQNTNQDILANDRFTL